jgi:hypothetical protein
MFCTGLAITFNAVGSKTAKVAELELENDRLRQLASDYEALNGKLNIDNHLLMQIKDK